MAASAPLRKYGIDVPGPLRPSRRCGSSEGRCVNPRRRRALRRAQTADAIYPPLEALVTSKASAV